MPQNPLSTCHFYQNSNPNLLINLQKFPNSLVSEGLNEIDSNRQKEILAKCISGVLINLYKQFKLNNVYQAESLAQQCVLGNSIRLILKLMNCNMLKQISNINDISALCPPVIVGKADDGHECL